MLIAMTVLSVVIVTIMIVTSMGVLFGTVVVSFFTFRLRVIMA
jgi:hypothetical protein